MEIQVQVGLLGSRECCFTSYSASCIRCHPHAILSVGMTFFIVVKLMWYQVPGWPFLCLLWGVVFIGAHSSSFFFVLTHSTFVVSGGFGQRCIWRRKGRTRRATGTGWKGAGSGMYVYRCHISCDLGSWSEFLVNLRYISDQTMPVVMHGIDKMAGIHTWLIFRFRATKDGKWEDIYGAIATRELEILDTLWVSFVNNSPSFAH